MCTHTSHLWLAKSERTLRHDDGEKKVSEGMESTSYSLLLLLARLLHVKQKGNMEHNFNVRFRIPEKFAQEAFFIYFSLRFAQFNFMLCISSLSLSSLFHRQAQQQKKVQHMQHDSFFFLIINSFYELFYFKLAFTSSVKMLMLLLLRCCCCLVGGRKLRRQQQKYQKRA
jgi:hypothetical protein